MFLLALLSFRFLEKNTLGFCWKNHMEPPFKNHMALFVFPFELGAACSLICETTTTPIAKFAHG